MHSVLSVVLCTLCVGVVMPPTVLAQNVFGSTSSGTFWGINMDSHASTVKYSLYPGYMRATGSMAYDAHSGHSLFEQFDPNVLSYGPMCSNSPGITPKFLFNITDALLEDRELGEAFTGNAGAFAMYRSKIYFLHYGSYESVEIGSTHRFQVRVLQSCEECGVDPYVEDPTAPQFISLQYTVRCSKLVAQLPNVVIGPEEIPIEYTLGKVLKIVGDKETDLTFYFQIGRLGEMSTEMLMHKISVGGAHELIHTQKIDNRYRPWNLRVIGAVDYLNGMLCWTTADRMLCRMNEDEPTKTIVQPSIALTKGICTGTSPQHLNDISGVSILRTAPERVVLFGCSPQTPNVSGSGRVTIAADGTVTNITAFKAEAESLSAASLVTIKTLPSECSFDPSPVMCVRLQPVTTETAPQIPTMPITPEPEVREQQTEVSDTGSKPGGGDTGEEVDNEPSGEPGATEEDTVVDDGKAVVGGDVGGSGGATCVQAAGKHALLQLVVVIAGCLLLS